MKWNVSISAIWWSEEVTGENRLPIVGEDNKFTPQIIWIQNKTATTKKQIGDTLSKI